MTDTDLFRRETIVALAVDGGPDIALDAVTKDSFYAGAVARRGEVSVVPVESPGPLYLAAESGRSGASPATLMALAGASSAAIDVDAAELVAAEAFFGGPEVFRSARRIVGDLVDRAEAALPLGRVGGRRRPLRRGAHRQRRDEGRAARRRARRGAQRAATC